MHPNSTHTDIQVFTKLCKDYNELFATNFFKTREWYNLIYGMHAVYVQQFQKYDKSCKSLTELNINIFWCLVVHYGFDFATVFFTDMNWYTFVYQSYL